MSRISKALVVSCLLVSSAAFAQHAHSPGHSQHPPEHAQLHNQFYAQWQRPGNKGSCCNDRDCYPTKAKFEDGKWWAQRREDGKWLPVPREVYDPDNPQMVQSPDGQPHLCAPPPNVAGYPIDFIFCFTTGMAI